MANEFTSSEVIRLSGITHRQLQWWTEQKLVTCRLHGKARYYTQVNVLKTMLIAELKRRGVGLHRIRKLEVSLDQNIELALRSTVELFLASDRRTLRLVDSRDSLQSLPEWLRGVFLIPISEFIQRIQAEKPFVRNAKVYRPMGDRRHDTSWMRGVAV